MNEIFHVDFDYEVVRARRDGRAGRPVLRRDRAAIEVATVRGADLPVAYHIEDWHEMGSRHPLILRHDARLWWPLVDRFSSQVASGHLLFHTRDARDFLRDLRDGKSDLFVMRGLDDPRVNKRHRGPAYHDGRKAALAAVDRNAKNLLIVDDSLFMVGGVPLLVEHYGIASAGADRVVAGPAGALRIKPANGHRRDVDFALCSRRFYVPAEFAAVMRRRPFRGARALAVDGDGVDPVVLRLDAGFRTAWRAMNRPTRKPRPDGFAALYAVFADACGPGDDDRLTATRVAALRGLLALFENAGLGRAGYELLSGVRRALSEVEASGLLPPPSPLTESEETALASFCV